MQASQLYKDELYAYYDSPPKGRTPLGAAKVRVRGTESRKSSWETNRRTYALVTVVRPGNRDLDTTMWGGYDHLYVKEGQELSVPARHIIAFWDDYESETSLLQQEAQERKDRRRRQALREQVLGTAINWKLQHEQGIRIAPVIKLYEDDSGSVDFPLGEVLEWLGISMQEINDKVDELMEV
jgi:hypothetical protein